MADGLSKHHRKCRFHGGENNERNISIVSIKKHEAYHILFSHKTPHEICIILNETWIDPDYEFICVIKRKRDT